MESKYKNPFPRSRSHKHERTINATIDKKKLGTSKAIREYTE